jgi:hypothetical protein
MALRWNRQNRWMAAVGRLAMDLAVFNLATVLVCLKGGLATRVREAAQ